MAQVIKSSGEVIETKPNNGTDFSLEELQAIVGGYIEVVSLRDGRLIVCDEEGKLKGKDFNTRATYILQAAMPTHDFVVGDVLVCDADEIK
jgi:hypothetical protein